MPNRKEDGGGRYKPPKKWKKKYKRLLKAFKMLAKSYADVVLSR